MTAPPHTGRQTVGQPAHPRDALAFVVHTRPYGASDVLGALLRSGFTSVERAFGPDTVQLIVELQPGLVVLAVDPAVPADLEIAADVAANSRAFVLLLTPGGTQGEVAAALRAGVDACLREDDGADAFEAQVEAIARRRHTSVVPAVAAPLVFGRLAIDTAGCRVTYGGAPVHLAPIEFRILVYLAANPGRVLSPGEILAAIRQQALRGSEAGQIVKVYIRGIRQKLEQAGARRDFVVNVRGFGYRFEPEPEAAMVRALGAG